VAQQETSALFSLKELMRLEETRIAEEQEQRRRQAEAAERARKEAEQAARERELARVRLEEERRRDEAARQREEAARLEAVRAAEVERVRLETVERAKLEALASQRAHEQHLAAIGAGKATKRLRWVTWLGAASLVALVGGGAALYFGKIQPSSDERARGLERIISERREETERLRRALDEQNAGLLELQKRIPERHDVTPPPAEPKPTPAKGPGRIIGKGKPPPPPPPPCTCDPHDPLCGCFAR
jgi:colicin import membrane protein